MYANKLILKTINVLVFSFIATLAVCQTVPTLDNLLNLKWKIKSHEYSTSLLIHGGLVFETYGIDYALKADTGEKLYYRNPSHQETIRKLCPDSLILFTVRKGISVVNIYNGKILYQSNDVINEPWISCPRIIDGGTLYTALNDTTFVALTVADWKVLWQKSVDGVYNVPVVEDNILYFGDKHYLYSLDKDTGKEKWKEEFGPFASDPIVNNGIIYVFVRNKGLISYSTKDGKTNWIIKPREKTFKNYIVHIEDERIFLSDINLYSFSISGDINWINENAKSATSFLIGLTRKYVLLFKVVDDFEILIACEKRSGKIAYEAFTDILSSDNSNKPLASLEGVNFRFSNKMYRNLLYAVDLHGNVYCFEVME